MASSISIAFSATFEAPSVPTPFGTGNATASRQVAMEEFHDASRQITMMEVYDDATEAYPMPRAPERDSRPGGGAGAGGGSDRARNRKRDCHRPEQQVAHGAVGQRVFLGADQENRRRRDQNYHA